MKKQVWLKRLQIVTMTDGRDVLQFNGKMYYGVEDLTFERGRQMLTRLLSKRTFSARYYRVHIPLDALCAMMMSYQSGRSGGDEYDNQLNEKQVDEILNRMLQDSEISETINDVTSRYMSRYDALFRQFYREALTRKGIHLDY